MDSAGSNLSAPMMNRPISAFTPFEEAVLLLLCSQLPFSVEEALALVLSIRVGRKVAFEPTVSQVSAGQDSELLLARVKCQSTGDGRHRPSLASDPHPDRRRDRIPSFPPRKSPQKAAGSAVLSLTHKFSRKHNLCSAGFPQQ